MGFCEKFSCGFPSTKDDDVKNTYKLLSCFFFWSLYYVSIFYSVMCVRRPTVRESFVLVLPAELFITGAMRDRGE